MACLPCFPIQPAPLAQGWHNSWLARSHCAIVDHGNVPKDLPTGNVIGHFLNYGFFFPDESSLCHNNKKLTTTKDILVRVAVREQRTVLEAFFYAEDFQEWLLPKLFTVDAQIGINNRNI